MTWLDYCILAILGLAVLRSFVRGAVREVFSFLAIITGYLAASRTYGYGASYLEWAVTDERLAGIISFIAVFVTIGLLVGALGRMVHAAAWFGIMLGVAISTVLIIVLPDWTKVFAILFLILGSYYIASYLGNVLIQDYAYRQGLRAFARAWARYRLDREQGLLDDD